VKEFMSIPTSLLVPCSSISTYGKIINSASKQGYKKKETREILLELEDEESKPRDAATELKTKESDVRLNSIYSSFGKADNKRASSMFLNKGKQCDRNAAKGSLEATPPPSHDNPRMHMVKTRAPIYSVPRPKTAMSRKLRMAEEEASESEGDGDEATKPRRRNKTPANEEGWYSGLHSALCNGRPSSALSATPQRTDRLHRTMSPWLCNKQQGETSPFRNTARKSLYDSKGSEPQSPQIDIVRPRSACLVNMTKNIDRSQRNKMRPEGQPFGAYTMALNYNKTLDNDVITKSGVCRSSDGQLQPTHSTIKMEHQVDRKSSASDFANTPGLEKLGGPLAVWGTDQGSVGGTPNVLTAKRSSFTKMNHIDREQFRKAGHIADGDQRLDVMYEINESLTRPRTPCTIGLAKNQGRKGLAEPAEGADKMYDWTNWVDKKQVAAPKIALIPDRETNAKQGFGSSADMQADLMYNHKKMLAQQSTRVKCVDIDRITGRGTESDAQKETYKDQIASGKAFLGIGELAKSPVFGSPRIVPDMGGKSRRFPVEKTKQSSFF